MAVSSFLTEVRELGRFVRVLRAQAFQMEVTRAEACILQEKVSMVLGKRGEMDGRR